MKERERPIIVCHASTSIVLIDLILLLHQVHAQRHRRWSKKACLCSIVEVVGPLVYLRSPSAPGRARRRGCWSGDLLAACKKAKRLDQPWQKPPSPFTMQPRVDNRPHTTSQNLALQTPGTNRQSSKYGIAFF